MVEYLHVRTEPNETFRTQHDFYARIHRRKLRKVEGILENIVGLFFYSNRLQSTFKICSAAIENSRPSLGNY